MILRIMHELPWITILRLRVRQFANDFHKWRITILGSRLRQFANDFHKWRSHEWKSLANRITSDPEIVIHGNECIILFLTRYFVSWTHNSAKNYRSLISPLSLRTVFSDLILWRHHSLSVTSRERRVLALWRHIHRLASGIIGFRSGFSRREISSVYLWCWWQRTKIERRNSMRNLWIKA